MFRWLSDNVWNCFLREVVEDAKEITCIAHLQEQEIRME